MKRRDLLKKSTALGALVGGGSLAFAQTSAEGQTKAPASDRIRVGAIGVGGMGTGDLRNFLSHSDVEVVAICDVFQPNLEKAIALTGGKAKGYGDYRRLLDDKSIDAVMIATPEHWHAIMAIDACDAGKDVYVEKPAGHYIHDSRLMVQASRAKKRVVQVGSQQRSGTHFQRAVKYIQDGRLGDVFYAACWNHSPLRTPRTPPAEAPAGLDWDMWLGPAPKRSYAEVMKFGGRGQGFWDFYGGMLTEWGAHLNDIVLWAMKAKGPESVVASGGLFNQPGAEIPDTLQVTYKYPKFLLHYSILNHNTFGLNGSEGAARFGSYGMQFHGTKGTLFIDRGEYVITPQTTRVEETITAPALPPGAQRPSREDMRVPGFYYTAEIAPERSDSSEQGSAHIRNFLDCVKSRNRPNADIEDGHNTNAVCRLGNIAYRVGRALKWDSEKEQVIGDAEANQLVTGTYREPWKPKSL
jgi:predicted dehydrogenase